MFIYALIHKDKDSAFGVTFPDVPGRFSAADKEEDMVANAIEALSLHFEGEPAITPSRIETDREDNADGLAQDAYLLAVPFVRRSNRNARYSVSIDTGTMKAIDAEAKHVKLPAWPSLSKRLWKRMAKAS